MIQRIGPSRESFEKYVVKLMKYKRNISKYQKVQDFGMEMMYNKHKLYFMANKQEFDTSDFSNETLDVLRFIKQETHLSNDYIVEDIKEKLSGYSVVDILRGSKEFSDGVIEYNCFICNEDVRIGNKRYIDCSNDECTSVAHASCVGISRKLYGEIGLWYCPLSQSCKDKRQRHDYCYRLDDLTTVRFE